MEFSNQIEEEFGIATIKVSGRLVRQQQARSDRQGSC
jgi:hypothetical protein